MRGLHHIGYWTDDLDAAMAQATRLLGVGPFQVLKHVDLGDFRFRGEPATLDHSAAFACEHRHPVADRARHPGASARQC